MGDGQVEHGVHIWVRFTSLLFLYHQQPRNGKLPCIARYEHHGVTLHVEVLVRERGGNRRGNKPKPPYNSYGRYEIGTLHSFFLRTAPNCCSGEFCCKLCCESCVRCDRTITTVHDSTEGLSRRGTSGFLGYYLVLEADGRRAQGTGGPTGRARARFSSIISIPSFPVVRHKRSRLPVPPLAADKFVSPGLAFRPKYFFA